MSHTTTDLGQERGDRLLGWDTVFAIRYSYVNDAIAASGRVPTSFNQTTQDEGDTLNMAGNFASWGLTVGGTGHAIMMRLHVPSVTLKRTNHSDQTRTDVDFIIRVSLAPHDGGAGPDGGNLVNFKIAAPDSGLNRDVVVEEVIYEGSESDTTVRFLLSGLMEEWLNENVHTFDFVFSTVNLNSRADKDHWQWLRPTATSYAVTDDRQSESTGIFAVLCMTEGREIAKDQEITRDTIPDGSNGAFLISKERFLSKVLAKGVGEMLDGPVTPEAGKVWPDDYFELTDDETMLTNTTALKIDQLQLKEGDDPVLATIPPRSFETRMYDSYLEIYFEALNHSYGKAPLVGYLLDVSHEIRTRNVAALIDGAFGLNPGTKEGDGELAIATHKIKAVKTDAGKTLDVILWVVSIIGLVLPAAGWVWGRFFAAGAEEIEGGAVAAAEVIAEGVPAAEDVIIADAAAAEAAVEITIAGQAVAFGRWLGAFVVSRRAFLIGMFSLAARATQEILPILIDKDIQGELPKYDEFAAEVMKPVAWPYSSGFDVTDVKFDNGFVSHGEPKFDETLV
ncbi:MAG: TULIP family P47-like protein [Pseudomonadota bacterium]